MDIKQLLQSTYSVGKTTKQYKRDSINRRKPDYVFSNKPFGQVYLNNMVASFKTDERIVEIVLLMGVATDTLKNAHRIAIALKDVNFEQYSMKSLCNLIKSENPVLDYVPDSDLIEMILEEEFQPLEGRTIIQKSTTERKFVVVENRIPYDGVSIMVRCSCFTGDTKVVLGDGSVKTLEELEGSTNFDIIGYNQENGKFEVTNALKCEKKQENVSVLNIKLDNDIVIKATPDHRFLLKSGEWVRAEDLVEGHSLRALYYDKEDNKVLTEAGKHLKLQKHRSREDYYTYIFLDPRKPGEYSYEGFCFKYEPFYVGKGKGNRCTDFGKKSRNSWCLRKINKIRKEGLEPIVVKQSYGLTELAALQLEEKIIKTIGMIKDNKGPLVNFKYSGDISSGVPHTESFKEYMRNNNPMFNKDVVDKAKKTMKKRGVFGKFSKRMKLENPMFNDVVSKKRVETSRRNGLCSSEYMSYISSFRTKETFQKIVEKKLKKDPNCFKNLVKCNLSKAHDKTRELIKEGKFHKQLDRYRREQSKYVKENLKNLTIRYISEIIDKYGYFDTNFYVNRRGIYSINYLIEKNLLDIFVGEANNLPIKDNYRFCISPYLFDEFPNNRKFSKQQMSSFTKTVDNICKIIKNRGFFNEDDYINDYKNNTWSINYLVKNNLLDDTVSYAYRKALGNHKVVSIEKDDVKHDVYCITSEYLGNFLVDTSDVNSNIVSGVVVENCSDSYYSWNWYNYDANCLIGSRPPAYKRKKINPDGSFTTVRNPHRKPGACKHILLLLGLLMHGGLIKDLPSLSRNVPELTDESILRPTYSTIEDDLKSHRLKKVDRKDVDKVLKKLKDRLKDLGHIRRGFNW